MENFPICVETTFHFLKTEYDKFCDLFIDTLDLVLMKLSKKLS